MYSALVGILLGFTLAAAAAPALAQGYPTKPLRFIVTQGPGGTSDILARAIAEKLGLALGQQVIVDNRPGAEGILGMEATAKAPPDGYTFVLSANSVLAINPGLYKKLPYDPVRDFDPVTLVGTVFYGVFLNPSVPANSLEEFIKLARSKPNKLNYGSGGSVAHVGTEMFNLATRIRLTYVPYKSNPPAMTDLMGGQLDMMLLPLMAAPQVRAGKLKAIAVTSPKRFPQLPDVPTMAEAGVPGFEFSAWVAIHVPAGVSADRIQKLNFEVSKVLSNPEIIELGKTLGFEAQSSTTKQLADLTHAEIIKFAKVIKDANIEKQ